MTEGRSGAGATGEDPAKASPGRATIGSTRDARRAGTAHAVSATPTSPMPTAMNVGGSVGLTW